MCTSRREPGQGIDKGVPARGGAGRSEGVKHVLDASALLAYLSREPGADVVRPLLDGAGTPP